MNTTQLECWSLFRHQVSNIGYMNNVYIVMHWPGWRGTKKDVRLFFFLHIL